MGNRNRGHNRNTDPYEDRGPTRPGAWAISVGQQVPGVGHVQDYGYTLDENDDLAERMGAIVKQHKEGFGQENAYRSFRGEPVIRQSVQVSTPAGNLLHQDDAERLIGGGQSPLVTRSRADEGIEAGQRAAASEQAVQDRSGDPSRVVDHRV